MDQNTAGGLNGGFSSPDRNCVGFSRVNTRFFWNGRIAEVAYWDVQLTDAEVTALANGVSPFRIRPADLHAYWKLHGLASPEPNCATTGDTRNLTLTGAPGQADHAPVATPFAGFMGWKGTISAVAAGGPAAGLRTLAQTGVGI
jgi:hypothetical protein